MIMGGGDLSCMVMELEYKRPGYACEQVMRNHRRLCPLIDCMKRSFSVQMRTVS
jgi:hypothetical protein